MLAYGAGKRCYNAVFFPFCSHNFLHSNRV
jgi:hypothetical protein